MPEPPPAAPPESPPAGSPQGGPPEALPPRRLLRWALLFYGALFAVALAWARLAGTPLFFASATDAARGMAPARDALAGLLAGGIAIGLSRELTRRTAWGEDLARALAGVLGRLPPVACGVLALLSGVAEEVFFRGLLLPRVGLVASSLLFGLAHFAPARSLLPWTGFSVLAGFGLGLLFEATGNLLAPITAHFLVNAVNLSWLSRHYAPRA